MIGYLHIQMTKLLLMFLAKFVLTWMLDKINKITYAPSEDSDLPELPPSLIRVFAVSMKKPWVLGYPLSPQSDLSLRWSNWPFVGFVMLWFIYKNISQTCIITKVFLVKMIKKQQKFISFLIIVCQNHKYKGIMVQGR